MLPPLFVQIRLKGQSLVCLLASVLDIVLETLPFWKSPTLYLLQAVPLAGHACLPLTGSLVTLHAPGVLIATPAALLHTPSVCYSELPLQLLSLPLAAVAQLGWT